MPDREHANDIEHDATEWAAKADRGLTSEERAELDAWMEADRRRLGAFVRAQAAWIHAERAVALGKMPEPGTYSLDPLADEAHKPGVLNRRTLLGAGGALAASIAAAYFVGFERYRTLESGLGEIRHIALEGGATLTLDTDSRVDIALSSRDGKLDLVRGTLFLDVPHRIDGSLLVKAGNLLIETAEGAFGVQTLLDAPIVALVTSGRLAVTQADGLFARGRRLTLAAGHRLAVPPGGTLDAGNVQPVSIAERERLLAWRDGMLSFGGELLANAVRAFDRYGSIRIMVDPELADQKITGLFKADDPRGFATAVAASFGGMITSEGEIIRISAKKAPSA